MCGRFEFDPDWNDFRRISDEAIMERISFDYKKGEVFPTNEALVLKSDDGHMIPHRMKWGFPKWTGKGVIVNARADTALKLRIFKDALLENRVVIPTTGFYEWAALSPKQKKKTKYLFTEPGEPFTWLAGFYNTFAGEELFTILTTDANKGMERYHSRMPIVLHTDERESWLAGEDMQHFLAAVNLDWPVRYGYMVSVDDCRQNSGFSLCNSEIIDLKQL